jgi:hypothetical protein
MTSIEIEPEVKTFGSLTDEWLAAKADLAAAEQAVNDAQRAIPAIQAKVEKLAAAIAALVDRTGDSAKLFTLKTGEKLLVRPEKDSGRGPGQKAIELVSVETEEPVKKP